LWQIKDTCGYKYSNQYLYNINEPDI